MWYGLPRQVLDEARAGEITLYTTAVLLAELEDTLHRKKFLQRLTKAGLKPRNLILEYGSLATLVEPAKIEPTIIEDPDDDAVLACAVAIKAQAIVSGDHHLLDLGEFQGIPILTAAELLSRLAENK